MFFTSLARALADQGEERLLDLIRGRLEIGSGLRAEALWVETPSETQHTPPNLPLATTPNQVGRVTFKFFRVLRKGGQR